MSMIDLPNDALEEIAKRTGGPLCNFADIHPRFASVVDRMRRPRIEATHICQSLLRSVANISWSVNVLILVNCHSESSSLLALISKCEHLTELNVVNSGLKLLDLIKSVEISSKLESISFTAIEPPEAPGRVRLARHSCLKNVYVEHCSGASLFLLSFIQSCLTIEKVHCIELPSPESNNLRWLYSMIHGHLTPWIRAHRWQTLHTVILTKVEGFQVDRFLWKIFDDCPALSNDVRNELFLKSNVVYHRGVFRVRSPEERILDDGSCFRHGWYFVSSGDPVWHYGQPRKLKLHYLPEWSPSGALSQAITSLTTLVDLDLSTCHWNERPEIWNPLFESSTGLQYLAVPFCVLTLRSPNTVGDDAFPFVDALEKLKLKELHCLGVDCGMNTCLSDPLLPNLTGLTHLEKLTIMEPVVGEDFLKRIAIRSLTCLKLYNTGEAHLNLSKLRTFFTTCKNLRYLKVDWNTLPLDEKLLWWRLSQANLKQLCLRSSSSKPVSLRMVKKFLPRICQGMDVLHIHALRLENAATLSSLMEAEINNMNLIREHNPIWPILPRQLAPDIKVGHHMTANCPGRAICSIRDWSRYELMGWKSK